MQQVALDGFAQRLAAGQQVLLADELVEAARPHALGERSLPGAGSGFRFGIGGKQRIHNHPLGTCARWACRCRLAS